MFLICCVKRSIFAIEAAAFLIPVYVSYPDACIVLRKEARISFSDADFSWFIF